MKEAMKETRASKRRVGWMTFRPRLALSIATVFTVAALVGAAAPAMAAVTCPNANPVVNENNCMGAGSQGWRLGNFSENIAGYTTQTSFAKGASVPLKIARNAPILPQTRVDITVYRTGYYGGEGARLIPGAGATNVPVNNNFSLQHAERHDGRAQLRELGRHLHDPRLRAARLGRLRGEAAHDGHERGEPRGVRGPGRQPRPRVARPAGPAHRDLSRLQHVGRQVAVPRQERRGGHRLRHRPRREGVLRPAARPERHGPRPLLRAGLLHGPVARAAGLRRLLHRRRPSSSQPERAARAQGARDPRTLRVLVPRAVPQLQGGARRRRQHRLLQRQHRVLEGPLREQHAHDGLLQDRPGRRVGRQRPRHAQRSRARRPGRHGGRRARPRRAGRAPPTITPRTPPPPSATTALPPATSTRRPAAASGRTCPRTSSSASCTSATTTAPTTR